MIQQIRTIDAHTGGQPVRLIVEGAQRPRGKTMAAHGEWLRRHADHIRRAVVLEPRGHADMLAAQFTEPFTPGAHAGIVFMDTAGYRPTSGSGIIAAATIALERRLFYSEDAGSGEVRLVLETEAGTLTVRARVEARGDRTRVDSVSYDNVPAFVYAPNHAVSVSGRSLRVDVAYGGLFYAIVDTEAAGIPLTGARLPDLRRFGAAVAVAVNASLEVRHPLAPHAESIAGVVFSGPAHDPEGQLRTVTVSAAGSVERSPGGESMSAVMSVLDAMGLLAGDQPFVLEGIAGGLFRGRTTGRRLVGDYPAISTEIQGTAWITGEHTFHLDDDDPFREGFSMPPATGG